MDTGLPRDSSNSKFDFSSGGWLSSAASRYLRVEILGAKRITCGDSTTGVGCHARRIEEIRQIRR